LGKKMKRMQTIKKHQQCNVVLVGAGNNAKVHAEGLRRHPDRVTLAAVLEPNPSRRSTFADRYGIERSYGTVQEMLEDSDSQSEVAIVSTPTNVRMDALHP
jgi:predicted dehydrogenase